MSTKHLVQLAVFVVAIGYFVYFGELGWALLPAFGAGLIVGKTVENAA